MDYACVIRLGRAQPRGLCVTRFEGAHTWRRPPSGNGYGRATGSPCAAAAAAAAKPPANPHGPSCSTVGFCCGGSRRRLTRGEAACLPDVARAGRCWCCCSVVTCCACCRRGCEPRRANAADCSWARPSTAPKAAGAAEAAAGRKPSVAAAATCSLGAWIEAVRADHAPAADFRSFLMTSTE